jgi:tyrosyl-tRNA synthetase
VLRKLRDFQRLGHTACLVIGDFTAMIGDPSGKSKTRPQLTREEVQTNVKAVEMQLYKILIPERTEITYNGDWLCKMTFEDVIRLGAKTTVAQILERDDFTNRWNEHKPIALHEIMYPLCQAYDSIALNADVELGGTDQKFNNLMGRHLQPQFGLEAQVVLLCPLLVGLDGKEKMSQSLGNYVSVVDTPNDMFGKVMSIPDEFSDFAMQEALPPERRRCSLIRNWFELCTDVPLSEVEELLAPSRNPRDAKVRLAQEIVALYHDQEAANAAVDYFRDTFSKREQPVEVEEAAIPTELVEDGKVSMAHLIATLGLAKSNGAARDLIKAGAVSLDGEKLSDPFGKASAEELVGKTLKVGKHRFRRLV